MTETSATIVIRGLEKEMTAAGDGLRTAFWKVAKLVEFDGSRQTQLPGYNDPRSAVDDAIKKLRDAADYYDAVQAQLNDAIAKRSGA